MSDFGICLRELREAAGLTQEELAARAGLTAKGIGALERGERRRPQPHTVRSLADALELSGQAREALTGAVPRRTGGTPVLEPAVVSLPPPAGELIGREQDIQVLVSLLKQDSGRLLTLTGTGGVGKTSLALEVARQCAPLFRDGAVFVDLAAVTDGELVFPVIAQALGLRAGETEPVPQSVERHLRHKHLLVVLDNLEHLLSVAPGIASLVAAAPDVRMLVTSRAPLRVRGEHEYPVAPLAVPYHAGHHDPDTVLASPAARLFLARVRAANPGFVLSDRNAAMVAEICRRLDGLPLALELTAARMRALGLPDVLARLGQVLRYRGGRDVPERQQTMLAAIDWSHDLLTAQEQEVFRQLGVFAGSFTLDSAEDVVVVDDDGEIAVIIERLVEQSLVMVRPQPDEAVRYHLLTPIRHYAVERLEASGDEAATAMRHAMHYRQFAEQARVGMRGPDQLHWFGRLDLEHDNVRRAMRWAIASEQVEIAARLGFSLESFWWVRGYQREGYNLMQQVMAMQDRMPMWLQELAMIAMSTTAYGIADYATVERLADDLLDLSERFDGAVCAGAFARVELGLLALRRGDYVAAERQLQASPNLFDAIGDQGMVSQALSFIGSLRYAQGDLASARQKFEEGLHLARTAGDRLGQCNALFNLAHLALTEGDLVTAGARFRDGIRPSLDMGDRPNLAFILEGLGVVAGAAGDHERAALLFGAAGGLFDAAGLRGHTYYAPDAALYERIGSQVRAALGDVAHEATCAIGRAMTLDAVLNEAYAETPSLGRQLAV